MKNPQKIIYEVIEDDYFDESNVKFLEQFLTKCITEFNIPPFIPREVKKKTQQVGLEYGLFSKIAKIKRELVLVVQNSSK